MAEFTEQVASPWPAEQTFDFMADVRNFQQWDPGVKHAVQVEGTVPALGAAYDVTVGGIGGDMVLRYRIVEFDRPRRVAIEALTPSLRSLPVVLTVWAVSHACPLARMASAKVSPAYSTLSSHTFAHASRSSATTLSTRVIRC